MICPVKRHLFSRAYATQIRRYREPWYSGPEQPPHWPADEPF
jgi:hypothetical protein